MKLDPRRIAVGLAGFCAFLNLYAPQAVLPLLAQEFSAGGGKASLAVGVALLLPKEQHFDRSDGLGASARQMVRHLKNPHLVATYAIGSGVLFNFVAIFTYVSFHLAAPPFGLSPTFLGAIFVVYLVGAAVTPLTGRTVPRFGRRPLMLGVLAMWAGGLLLSAVPARPVL